MREGGRTGFTAVVCAVFFLISIVLWPLFSSIPDIATSPILCLIGELTAHALTVPERKLQALLLALHRSAAHQSVLHTACSPRWAKQHGFQCDVLII